LLSSYLAPGHWPPASRRLAATVRARVGTPFAVARSASVRTLLRIGLATEL